VPDVFARRPVIVFGKWRGEPTGTVELTGVSGHGRFVSRLEVADAARSTADTGALPYLWARSRIATLSDFGQAEAHRQQVIDLGLRYNLLTRFTSFIAVHQKVRSDGRSVDVDQPLPMPAGVSDSAVGVESGPEPPLALLLALVLAFALWQAWRRQARRAA
jgi:Ca-activated chloride channel family protein